jgi:hypothetical protein
MTHFINRMVLEKNNETGIGRNEIGFDYPLKSNQDEKDEYNRKLLH